MKHNFVTINLIRNPICMHEHFISINMITWEESSIVDYPQCYGIIPIPQLIANFNKSDSDMAFSILEFLITNIPPIDNIYKCVEAIFVTSRFWYNNNEYKLFPITNEKRLTWNGSTYIIRKSL